ncbi:MAG TPA: flagellar biosynthetic protein FliR [Epulopiscium sp.]|nr:flagellar biosynthetic protein FliR [Candidatus Epulonipiscium sp.]
MNAIIDFYTQIDIFLLVFTRIIALLSVVPIFSDKSVPEIAKAGLALMISIIVVYSNPMMEINYNASIVAYGVLILKEIVVGLIIGFVIYMMFQVFFFVGQLVSMASGLSMSNMFDPTIGQQVPTIGVLYNYVASALFLVTNGHHIIFRALIHSYLLIPIGEGQVNAGIIDQFIRMLNSYFIISVKIAAPIMVTMFILDFALGILARTAPQMNMFVIGFPIKIMASLIMLLMATVLMNTAYMYVYDQIDINLLEVIQGMRK